jgi:hypothetical protein
VFLTGGSLYAFKGLAGKLGPIGVHVALLLTMAGTAYSGVGGFKGSVMLPEVSEWFYGGWAGRLAAWEQIGVTVETVVMAQMVLGGGAVATTEVVLMVTTAEELKVVAAVVAVVVVMEECQPSTAPGHSSIGWMGLCKLRGGAVARGSVAGLG